MVQTTTMINEFPRKSALEKMMDLLARREHSEHELRQKLARDYHPDDIDDALQQAYQKKWLASPADIAARVAAGLDQKNKGYLYIIEYLAQKSLPAVARDQSSEVAKAQRVIAPLIARFNHSSHPHDSNSHDADAEYLEMAKPLGLDYDQYMKLHRALAARGFDDEAIHAVLGRTES